MSLSDVAISTSRQEGLPVNVMEAMATKRPLVVTDCSGNRDLVHNGINGYVIKIDDYKGMAAKISNLIQNEALRKIFGTRITVFIIPYEIENVKPKMNIIYQKHTNSISLSDLPLRNKSQI